MANEDEIALGRVVVARGLGTEEQVLDALRERNAHPTGPDLGALLVRRGLFSEYVLNELRRVARDGGEDEARRGRHEATTDHQFNLGGAREAIARECLNEARAALTTDRAGAVAELRRLAEDFADTESGNEARKLLGGLEG